LPKGKKTHIYTFDYQNSNEFYNKDGKREKSSRFTAITTSFLREKGLTDNYTFGTKVLAKRVNWLSPTYGRLNYYYAGDTELYIRGKIFQNDKQTFSLQHLIKLPPPSLSPPQKEVISNGKVEYEMRGLYGSNFYQNRAFLNYELGFREVSNSKTQSLKSDTTVGYRANDKVQIHFKTFQNIPTRKNPDVSANFVDDYSSTKLQLSVVYSYNDKYKLEFGGYQTPYGKNVANQGGGLFSVWREF
jgi:hypothetical protein